MDRWWRWRAAPAILGTVVLALVTTGCGGAGGWWEAGHLTGRPEAGTAASVDVERPADAQQARVERVIDGDTVALRAVVPGRVIRSTSQVTARLLEVDTPETKHPDKPVECYGPQAVEKLRTLLRVGTRVWVARDAEARDRYGRYLLYVWTTDGAFVNGELVASGHATVVLYPPNDRYIDRLREVEQRARRAGTGIWGACQNTRPTPPGNEDGQDPRFESCEQADGRGYGPYRRDRDAEYGWYDDGDRDGVVCE